MANSTLDDEHAALMAATRELAAAHLQLQQQSPGNITAHRAHLARLEAHIARLHRYIQARGFENSKGSTPE